MDFYRLSSFFVLALNLIARYNDSNLILILKCVVMFFSLTMQQDVILFDNITTNIKTVQSSDC